MSLGSTHTEVCNFDTQLMSGVLELHVEQTSCMLLGDRCCQFTVITNTNEMETTLHLPEMNLLREK
jgi:hypothetical protein